MEHCNFPEIKLALHGLQGRKVTIE